MRFLLFIATALLLARPAIAWEYRNPEFGFSVTVPEEFPRCEVGEHHPFYHEDGFVAFIDGKPGDCIEQLTRRVFGHFGVYNAALHANLNAMREASCSTPYEPDQWHISGLVAQACREDKPDGWIGLIVLAASTQMEKDPDGELIPRVKYFAYLHTRQETLTEDIRLLKAQLGRVSFFSPE